MSRGRGWTEILALYISFSFPAPGVCMPLGRIWQLNSPDKLYLYVSCTSPL